jgi:hypothetical protein
MVQSSPLRRTLLPLALTAFWLAGCSTPAQVADGTEQAAVLARVGTPAERHKLAAGERWVYPLGGLNQETWMVDLDPAGRVANVQQVLDMKHFMRVKVDVDTMADVRRELGPPRLVRSFSRVQLTAWLYAYRENGLWNSEMAIYFDPQGIVRKVENGPDPRFLGGGDRRD